MKKKDIQRTFLVIFLLIHCHRAYCVAIIRNKKKKKLGKPLYDILRYFYRISIYTYNRQVEIMVVDIL